MTQCEHVTLNVRALILDMDDTINQTTPAMRAGLHAATCELWPQLASDRVDAAVARYAFDEAGWFRRFSTGQIDFKTMRRGRLADLADQLDGHVNDQEFEHFEQTYRQVFIGSCRIFDDARELIRQAQAQEIPMAVLSNSAHEMTLRKMNQIGVENCFSAVICADQLSAGKPDKGAYLAACKALGYSPEEVGYVDDLHRDAHGAAQTGLHSVWLDRIGLHRTAHQAIRDLSQVDKEHLDRAERPAIPTINQLSQLSLQAL